MTRKEHLLIIAMEECNEVAQRISKALRFTLEEVQPEQNLNNADRIIQEFNDLTAVMLMLEEEGFIKNPPATALFQMKAKKIKVEKFLNHSESVGTLKNESPISN